MRKHPDIVISQVFVPQINLDIDNGFTLSSVASTPDHQKYHVDDMNETTPCTLLYVKGGMLRTIKVADAIVMATRIMHGRPILSDCAVVKVTMIREGHEFEYLDYPDEEEGIEKLKDAKGDFIVRPRKDIILRTRSSPIVSTQNREDEGTPASQNTMCSTTGLTPPSQNTPQTILPPKNPPSIQLLEHHSLLCHSPPHTATPQIHQLNKFFNIVLCHVLLFQCLHLTLPLLLKIHQLNKLFNIVLHHV
jgi:hypothetical protein